MLDTSPKNEAKHPTVMIAFQAWNRGGPIANIQRLSKALRDKGCHVVWATNYHSEYHLPRDPEADEVHAYRKLGDTKSLYELKDIKPDILITEQYPFIHDYDKIDEFVEAYKKTNPDGQLYGLVRDMPTALCSPRQVINTLQTPNHDTAALERAVVDWLDQEYDHIFIRGDENVVSMKNIMDDSGIDFSKMEEKISHAGYLIPKAGTEKTEPHDPPKIVVSLGGAGDNCDLDTYKGIIQKVKAMSGAFRNPIKADWHFYVGTSYDPRSSVDGIEFDKTRIDELHRLARQASKKEGVNVQIHPALPNFLQSIEEADLVICAGGMTAVEAVAYKKPVVCIPHVGEQERRAEGLKNLMGDAIEIYKPIQSRKNDALDKTVFEETFRKQFARIGRHVNHDVEVRINGHETIADEIVSRYNDKNHTTGQIRTELTGMVDATSTQYLGQTDIQAYDKSH